MKDFTVRSEVLFVVTGLNTTCSNLCNAAVHHISKVSITAPLSLQQKLADNFAHVCDREVMALVAQLTTSV
jgi:hypothetical protein